MPRTRHPKPRTWFALCLLAAGLLLLASCGGGGGGAAPASNNWDELPWDTGTWQ